MMMSLLGFTLLVIFGVVASQTHDVNLQTQKSKRSVEATTPIPPDPTINDEGLRFLLTRLESLCVENLQFLITETDRRFLSLETVNNLLVKKLDNLTTEVALMKSSVSATPVVQNCEIFDAKVDNLGKNIQELMDATRNLPADVGVILKQNVSSLINVTSQSLEVHSTVNKLLVKKLDNLTTEVARNSKIFDAKVENLGKNIQELMDVTKNLPSDVGAIKQNVSSLINVTRSLVNLSSNSELKQICNEGLQEVKDLQTVTSIPCPINVTLNKPYPKNCRKVQKSEKTASGTFMIQPEGAPKPFEVVCELETRGGGWTVIQRRFDGSQDFYLDWQHYRNGFGNLNGEFWLGLENIHLLTGFEDNELLIELGDFESKNVSASYSKFRVGSEIEGYPLKELGAYSGDAGDSLIFDIGNKFTTKDNDQETYSSANLAEFYRGAWWYTGSTHCSLNGMYFDRGQIPNPYYITVSWLGFKNNYDSLKNTRMLVRPKL